MGITGCAERMSVTTLQGMEKGGRGVAREILEASSHLPLSIPESSNPCFPTLYSGSEPQTFPHWINYVNEGPESLPGRHRWLGHASFIMYCRSEAPNKVTLKETIPVISCTLVFSCPTTYTKYNAQRYSPRLGGRLTQRSRRR